MIISNIMLGYDKAILHTNKVDRLAAFQRAILRLTKFSRSIRMPLQSVTALHFLAEPCTDAPKPKPLDPEPATHGSLESKDDDRTSPTHS